MTAPGSASPARRWTLKAVQFGLLVAVLALAGRQLWRQWTDASRANLAIDVNWLWLGLATVTVMSTYLMLVETWRQVLRRLGAEVAFGPAARVWFASNLGKYLPGKIWTVSAMVVMIARVGVPASIAGGSVVVITIAQTATGFAVVALTSMPTVRQLTGGTVGVVVTLVALLASLAMAPVLARQWNRLAARLGREQLKVDIPRSAVAVALVGCGASWFLYGVAFELLVRSLIGSAPAATTTYTAAYAASYMVGFIALFAPGGLGAREWAMALILPSLGLATQAQAVVITVVSRLWLTAVELVPSLIAAARSATRPSAS